MLSVAASRAWPSCNGPEHPEFACNCQLVIWPLNSGTSLNVCSIPLPGHRCGGQLRRLDWARLSHVRSPTSSQIFKNGACEHCSEVCRSHSYYRVHPSQRKPLYVPFLHLQVHAYLMIRQQVSSACSLFESLLVGKLITWTYTRRLLLVFSQSNSLHG